jgi:cation diffusion facilitator CzcD-associated flavoprotein CzcO
VVIFATGFDLEANLEQITITGPDGVSLEKVWAGRGVSAHHGIMVSGFPNLFLLLGPNTGLGHNSVVFMIEAQIGFVLRALAALDAKRGRQIDVRARAQARSVGAVQSRLAGTVWQSGCRSWYLDEDGRNIAIWPRTTMRYWLAVRRIRRRDYVFGS